jgi:hypothetical protein
VLRAALRLQRDLQLRQELPVLNQSFQGARIGSAQHGVVPSSSARKSGRAYPAAPSRKTFAALVIGAVVAVGIAFLGSSCAAPRGDVPDGQFVSLRQRRYASEQSGAATT